jgi:hypothetical protein
MLKSGSARIPAALAKYSCFTVSFWVKKLLQFWHVCGTMEVW